MNALVVGGAGSGKSAFAERLACSLSEQRTYVATMLDAGPEAYARIERHRQQRVSGGFATVECPSADRLASPELADAHGVLLLDDLGNLVANTLFAADGSMADPDEALDALYSSITAVAEAYDHTVIVGNLVGSEGPYPYEGTNTWVRLVGALCCQLAARFDTVIEVTAGCPDAVKGVIPCAY